MAASLLPLSRCRFIIIVSSSSLWHRCFIVVIVASSFHHRHFIVIVLHCHLSSLYHNYCRVAVIVAAATLLLPSHCCQCHRSQHGCVIVLLLPLLRRRFIGIVVASSFSYHCIFNAAVVTTLPLQFRSRCCCRIVAAVAAGPSMILASLFCCCQLSRHFVVASVVSFLLLSLRRCFVAVFVIVIATCCHCRCRCLAIVHRCCRQCHCVVVLAVIAAILLLSSLPKKITRYL